MKTGTWFSLSLTRKFGVSDRAVEKASRNEKSPALSAEEIDALSTGNLYRGSTEIHYDKIRLVEVETVACRVQASEDSSREG